MGDIQYILRVIDFETTGIPEIGIEHSVVEAAFLNYDAENKNWISQHSTLVQPTTEMDICAQAVHHISEAEATRYGKPWDTVADWLARKEEGQELIYVAHNASYEQQFFNPEGSRWIDTYKVALRLYPDAPKHSNQVLKYYLGITDTPTHHPPHRALPDAVVTAQILMHMAAYKTFNDMIKISKQPPYLTKISFGKHAGEKFEDIPHDYLRWVLTQQDMDEGVRAAAERVLG